MFSVKSEPCGAFEVGTESQRTSVMDDNPRVSDNLNINTSENQRDKSLSNEILMTVTYVKNESTSNTLNYATLNCKRNDNFYEQNLTDISVMKTEKKEVCTDNTSEDVTDHEHDTMQAKETSHLDCIKGTDINHMADISQHDKVGDIDIVDMEDVCSSSATKARAKTQKCTQKILHSGERRFMCDLCTYCARQLSDLKRHKLVHSRERPYKCDLCDYSTAQSGNLKMHKLIHTREKPYKCDLCDYSATQSGALKIHTRVHTGEKPYKCDVCDYNCTTSRHLKTHKLIHSKVKPYKCDICDYGSTQSGSLKRHTLIHSGEKPYQCDLCDYSATQYGHIKRHKLIHSGK